MRTNAVLRKLIKVVVVVLHLGVLEVFLERLSHVVDLTILSFELLDFAAIDPCECFDLGDGPLSDVGSSKSIFNRIGLNAQFLKFRELRQLLNRMDL